MITINLYCKNYKGLFCTEHILYNHAYAALKFRPYTDLKHDVNENLRPKGRIFVVELFCELLTYFSKKFSKFT